VKIRLVSDEPRKVIVTFKVNGLDRARWASRVIEDTLPLGYAHILTSYQRSHRRGAKYGVRIMVMHTDSREKVLRMAEFLERFEHLEDPDAGTTAATGSAEGDEPTGAGMGG